MSLRGCFFFVKNDCEHCKQRMEGHQWHVFSLRSWQRLDITRLRLHRTMNDDGWRQNCTYKKQQLARFFFVDTSSVESPWECSVSFAHVIDVTQEVAREGRGVREREKAWQSETNQQKWENWKTLYYFESFFLRTNTNWDTWKSKWDAVESEQIESKFFNFALLC